jgi:hypothetical protein
MGSRRSPILTILFQFESQHALPSHRLTPCTLCLGAAISSSLWLQLLLEVISCCACELTPANVYAFALSTHHSENGHAFALIV